MSTSSLMTLLAALLTFTFSTTAAPVTLLSTHWPGRATDTQQLRPIHNPRTSVLSAPPSMVSQLVVPGSLNLQQSDQPIVHWPAKVSTGLTIFFPASSQLDSSSRQRLLEEVRDSLVDIMASQSPQKTAPQRKRNGQSASPLCHMLGFPMSAGCPQENTAWNRLQTRSGTSSSNNQSSNQRNNNWPSMYLLGGAIGR
ncbi:uncharacterized protein [Littorina saxatilis]|uniref:uncharacterized protein n=1 Tax=Littorina saxatilis TaxID=31220 RepID=UPI0038B59B35